MLSSQGEPNGSHRSNPQAREEFLSSGCGHQETMPFLVGTQDSLFDQMSLAALEKHPGFVPTLDLTTELEGY